MQPILILFFRFPIFRIYAFSKKQRNPDSDQCNSQVVRKIVASKFHGV